MSRNGKIARLLHEVRETPQRGEEGHFVGLPLSPTLSPLLRRGAREKTPAKWRAGKVGGGMVEHAAGGPRGGAGELVAAGGSLTDKLAIWVTARYVVAARNLGSANGGKMGLNILHALCNDVVALRRGDHDAARLEIERKRMELERAKKEGLTRGGR